MSAAPGASANLTVTRDTDTGEADVTWDDAPDPPLPNGSPGSGPDRYTFRYKVNGGSWSAPAETSTPDVVLAASTAGDVVTVEVRATDIAGNVGPSVLLSSVTAATSISPSNVGATSATPWQGPVYTSAAQPNEDTYGAGAAALAYTEDNCPTGTYCGTYGGRAAARYARRWFSRRNPQYNNFGNDCTNFISQALVAAD